MQSSIEAYLQFSACKHFKCQYHSSNSSSCFFCYNGQPLQISACLYQATRIDAGNTSNFARMSTDATKRKHYYKWKHFPTLGLAQPCLAPVETSLNSDLSWQGVLKHGLSQAYKLRNNETNKELRPITPQCKCGLRHCFGNSV